MEDIGATSFTVAEAVAELVANSIDARPDEGAVRVDVYVTPEEISILDDAVGMSLDILAEAVRLGVKMDEIRGTRRPRKGMFGLGMKTAAASLGRFWCITTRPVDTNTEFYVEFDLKAIRARRGDGTEWRIGIDQRERTADGILGNRPCGTAIAIRKLRERNPMAGPVLELLGNAYKPHIEHGDVITVDGVEARPREYSFIEGTRKEIDLKIGHDGEYPVKGWVALDKTTHNAGDYGFNIYRQGQLVEAWSKEWFPPHLMTSRIVGEVELDFVAVNFNKKGFQTQTPEWKLAAAAMKEFLRPVVKASRDVSRGRNDRGKFARAVEGLDRAMGTTSTITQRPDDLDDEQAKPLPAETKSNEEVAVGPNVLHLPEGDIHLSYLVEEFDSEQTPWDYLFDEDHRELQAVLNSNSRLFLQVKDEKFLGMLAIADCVTRFLVDTLLYRSG